MTRSSRNHERRQKQPKQSKSSEVAKKVNKQSANKQQKVAKSPQKSAQKQLKQQKPAKRLKVAKTAARKRPNKVESGQKLANVHGMVVTYALFFLLACPPPTTDYLPTGVDQGRIWHQSGKGPQVPPPGPWPQLVWVDPRPWVNPNPNWLEVGLPGKFFRSRRGRGVQKKWMGGFLPGNKCPPGSFLCSIYVPGTTCPVFHLGMPFPTLMPPVRALAGRRRAGPRRQL